MKAIFLTLLISSVTYAQYNLSEVGTAIGKGDTEQLFNYFDDQVDLAITHIDGRILEDVFDREKTIHLLSEFFDNNEPVGFSKMHEGSSRANSAKYCIGNLQTTSGNFRVYIYYSVTESQVLIQELRFDQE